VIEVHQNNAVIEVEPPASFHAWKADGRIRIGAFSYTQGGQFRDVEIGRYCAFAPGVALGLEQHPTDWLSISPFQYGRTLADAFAAEMGQAIPVSDPPVTPRPDPLIRIGNDVWLGQEAVVNPGVSIGDGAVIATRAVVTRDVPAYAIVGGVPAKLIRYRFDPALIARLLEARWWRFSMADLAGLPFNDPARCLDEIEARGLTAYEPTWTVSGSP
jgi:acetyltransferase-like isoleucine patch superfamily enzyme